MPRPHFYLRLTEDEMELVLISKGKKTAFDSGPTTVERVRAGHLVLRGKT